MSDKKVSVGQMVIYVSPTGQSVPALVTQVWGPNVYPDDKGQHPSLNVVFVDNDETRTDTYGRQTSHATSVVHKINQAAHGSYWQEPT